MNDHNIGFIGLGNVGLKLASNILQAGYNLFIKLASSQNFNNTNSIAATLCLQIFALIVTSIFSVYLFSKGVKNFCSNIKGIYIYAVFAGISIGCAEIGYFYLFNTISYENRRKS